MCGDASIHLITWEKDYQADADEDWGKLTTQHGLTQSFGTHTHNRLRNNARDRRPYHFEYISRPWAKNPAIRQIVVRATNPGRKTVQLAILTDDNERALAPIVRLMFNRWVQENDFKYLNKHFGINQLTSYRSTPYEQLRDELTDRQVPNHAFVEKVKIGRRLEQKKARQLLSEDQARRDAAQRQQIIAIIEAGIARRASESPSNTTKPTATLEEKKAIARNLNAGKRHEKYRQERAKRRPRLLPRTHAERRNSALDGKRARSPHRASSQLPAETSKNHQDPL